MECQSVLSQCCRCWLHFIRENERGAKRRFPIPLCLPDTDNDCCVKSSVKSCRAWNSCQVQLFLRIFFSFWKVCVWGGGWSDKLTGQWSRMCFIFLPEVWNYMRFVSLSKLGLCRVFLERVPRPPLQQSFHLVCLFGFPQHKKCYPEGGRPWDSRCHPAGVWRVAGCDSPTLRGRSVQRPGDWQAWRRHHYHLRFWFSRWQLTLRWGGRIPRPRLFSGPRHRRRYTLWLRWALDAWEPQPWWWVKGKAGVRDETRWLRPATMEQAKHKKGEATARMGREVGRGDFKIIKKRRVLNAECWQEGI